MRHKKSHTLNNNNNNNEKPNKFRSSNDGDNNGISAAAKMSQKYNLKMANDCFSRHCLLNIV